jgi:hypothetical protein
VDLNFFQNVEKSVSAKAFGNNNKMEIPVNQVWRQMTKVNDLIVLLPPLSTSDDHQSGSMLFLSFTDQVAGVLVGFSDLLDVGLTLRLGFR